MKFAAITTVFLVLSTAGVRGQTYTVVDLGITGTNADSSSSAINNSGLVAGSSNPASNAFEGRAVLFQDSGNVPLGFLDGTVSFARAINASGQIVGNATLASGFSRAILFSGTGSANINLGTLPGGNTSTAFGINAGGQIVGVSQNAGGSLRATRFGATPAGNVDLGTLGGVDSTAYAINDSGSIVGTAKLANGEERATLFGESGNINLGTLGGNSSRAFAINSAGVIVGEAEFTDFFPRATRFSGTGTGNENLGTLSGGSISRALGINSAGHIVGEAEVVVGDTSFFHGFIYRDGMMLNLNDLIPPGSGVVIMKASGINDLGQITANGRFTDGRRRALRLDPAGFVPPGPASFLISVKAKPKSKGKAKGGGNYAAGTIVTVRAKPKKGSEFLGWKVGPKTISKKRTYRFAVTGGVSLSARFR